MTASLARLYDECASPRKPLARSSVARRFLRAWTERLTRVIARCLRAAWSTRLRVGLRDVRGRARTRACASATSSRGCGSRTRAGPGACRRPVFLKRFFAPEWDFIFGMRTRQYRSLPFRDFRSRLAGVTPTAR